MTRWEGSLVNVDDVKNVRQQQTRNTQEALNLYKKSNPLLEVDSAAWKVKHKFNNPLFGKAKLLKLKLDNPVFFDAMIRKWEQPTKREKDILEEVARENGLEKAPKKIPTPFTREFYSAMATAGYQKFSPENLAKIYSRLNEIATCDYVEPRDAIAASKVILQYNDMDVGQIQKQDREIKDELAMNEVKSFVSEMKKQFLNAKDVEGETIAS